MPIAALYARYSSDLQTDASIEDQLRLCEERAMREGWDVRQRYTDHATSGASLIRPGIQQLMQDAGHGRYDLIVAESLDRLSRDLEDIAGLYKRLTFAGVKIVTLSEGEVTDLHIGLKGTMGQLYLKDLADKTRRGLRGRVEAGRSGGGNSYGYDVVHTIGGDGLPARGERRVNAREAAVVRRIFEDYAVGASPRAIAHALNAEGVPGPSGKGWGPSTIHGNRQRGTGILNNELYLGRLVWNRLRYVKDPETGKRISRLNPEEAWIVKDVPELRIVDQDLWDRVKARQGAMRAHQLAKGRPGYWDRRRPRYLFSGLMRCGVCGDGVIQLNSERVGCAGARNKGTCGNRLTMRRDALEALVLDGLEHHLMEPDLVALFCEHYTRHLNSLVARHNAGLEADRGALEKVTREQDRLVQAILDGVPGSQIKDKMTSLEQQRQALERRIQGATEMPVSLHPSLATVYREQIGQLREALRSPDKRDRAVVALRPLIERIELTPTTDASGKQILAVTLHGHLAGLLRLARHTQKPSHEGGSSDISEESVKLVAGVGFEPTTFRL